MTDDGEGSERSERRREERAAVRIKVRFRSTDELISRYTTDMSRGGMFVATAEALPLDSAIELALELPDGGPPAIVRGRVASALDEARARQLGRQPGLGISFTEDTVALGERIAAFFANASQGAVSPSALPVHVLVAEDSSAYRAQIESALRAAGHRVTSVENGLTALGAAVREPPDLVLCDVNMPLMDGWQLLRILRERPTTREIPIVFLTTLGGDADRLRGYQLGVDDYLGKPFEPAGLAERLRKVIERIRAERAEGPSALRGDLAQVSVASLLSFVEAERRSGVLLLRGAGEASVHLRQGLITRVDLPEPSPSRLRDRTLLVLDFRQGRFAMTQSEPADTDDALSIQSVLLEHARLADEATREQ